MGARTSDRGHRDAGGHAVGRRGCAGDRADGDGRSDAPRPPKTCWPLGVRSGSTATRSTTPCAWARSANRCSTTCQRRCAGPNHDRRRPNSRPGRPRRGDHDRRGGPLRGRPGRRRAGLAGHPALVFGRHASGDSGVRATQRQGRAEPGDRPRLGQRSRRRCPTPKRSPSQRKPRSVVYSAAKAITTTVVHMLVERGAFSLDDRVCEYLPTYTSHGKHRTTIRHVMTHSAGVPFATGPKPDLKRMNDSEYAREMLGNLRPIYPPGLVHIYHALTWGPLDPRDRVRGDGPRHPRDPGHRDPRPARIPVDELRCCTTRCSAGRTQPPDRQATVRGDRRRSSARPSAGRCDRSFRSRTPRSS